GVVNGLVTDVGPEGGLIGGLEPFLFNGPDEILVMAGRAGIHKTIDGGQNWMRSGSGLVDAVGVEPGIQSLCQSRSAPEIASASPLFDGVYGTSNFADSWDRAITPMGNPGWSCAVDPSDPAVVYALAQYPTVSFPGRLFKSTDGGSTFSAVGAGLPDQQQQFSFGLAVAPTNPSTVYVGLSLPSSGLYVSSDGGLNFQPLPNSPSFPYAVYAHPTDDGSLLVLTDSTLFLSVDGGASFSPIGDGLPRLPGTLAFDPVDPSVVYAPGGPDGLFRSVDGARTFKRLDALEADQLRGLGVTAVGVGPRNQTDPPVIYASTSLGPIRSDDGGSTFAPIHNG